MDFANLIPMLPRIEAWIDQYIASHRDNAIGLDSRPFGRLGLYFSPTTLLRSKVVYVPEVVTPPLRALGVDGFGDFESGYYEGISYKDFMFVSAAQRECESLHFHEVVHLVQWRELGAPRFLLLYAKGLAEDGYHDCPLEYTAYRSQEEFDKRTLIPDFEAKLVELIQRQAQEAGLG